MQATKRITREDDIIKADRDSRMWLKDNPSNVRALQRTSLIMSWSKTLSYRRTNPSIKNPTAKSCKKFNQIYFKKQSRIILYLTLPIFVMYKGLNKCKNDSRISNTAT